MLMTHRFVPAAKAMAPMLLLTPAAPAIGSTVYALDDGAGNVGLGPPSSFDADMLFGNYFYAQPGANIITELSVALNELIPNEEFTMYLFDDPDDDGDPINAQLVAEVSGTPLLDSQDGFNTFSIDPTEVSGGFFVGANVFALGGVNRPARVDPQGDATNSWLFYDGVINTGDLSQSGFITRMDGPFVPIPGAFMVRAAGVPTPGTALVLAGAAGFAARRRR
ncbi:MAG: hypothetical protein AAGG07_04615 [Planctomycetota bacterium]